MPRGKYLTPFGTRSLSLSSTHTWQTLMSADFHFLNFMQPAALSSFMSTLVNAACQYFIYYLYAYCAPTFLELHQVMLFLIIESLIESKPVL
jgi:hypothetical protein